jgi:hypothetical protein
MLVSADARICDMTRPNTTVRDSETVLMHTVALKPHIVFLRFRVRSAVACRKLVKWSNRVIAGLDWLVETASKTTLAAEGPDF